MSKRVMMDRYKGSPYYAEPSLSPMPTPINVVESCRIHGSSILRRCMSILGSRAEAEDATQEVFVTLLEKGTQFRADAELGTWIYRITTNICLNRLRGNQRRQLRQDSDEVADWTTIAPRDPYQHYEAKTMLVSLLQELDDLDQRIFVFQFLDGLTQEEIASVTNKSRRTIGKRMRRLGKKFSRIASETPYA